MTVQFWIKTQKKQMIYQKKSIDTPLNS